MARSMELAKPAPGQRMSLEVPACVTIGLTPFGPRGLPGCSMDGRLPAACDADGRLSRGAALILADQALACGIYAALARPMPMMTLDLRLDWHGLLPAAREVGFGTTRVVIEGALVFVEGELLADGVVVASGSGRFLTGSMPGGGQGGGEEPVSFGASDESAFEGLLGLLADGDGWRVEPDARLVGARSLPAYHGGFIAALMDAACSRLAPGHRAVDQEIRYMRPARADLPLRVVAKAVRPGRLASVLEAEVVQGGAQLAVSRALFSGVEAAEGEIRRFE